MEVLKVLDDFEKGCNDNDHKKVLDLLDTMREMKKSGTLPIERFVYCLIISANVFAEHDNLEFFKVYQGQMQDITTIDPTINKFSSKACSYYYSAKWRRHIQSKTGVSDEHYPVLAKLLAQLAVCNNNWLSVLPVHIYTDAAKLFATLGCHITNGIPLDMRSRRPS